MTIKDNKECKKKYGKTKKKARLVRNSHTMGTMQKTVNKSAQLGLCLGNPKIQNRGEKTEFHRKRSSDLH